MGFFSRFKRNKNEVRSIIVKEYHGDPRYFAYNYSRNIMDIPEVATAIRKFAEIVSIVPIWHKREDKDGFVYYPKSDIFRVLTESANPLQCAEQFRQNVIIDWLLFGNEFIEPVYQNGKLICVYPLPFHKPKFSIINDGKAVVKFSDGANPSKEYDLSNLIYLNRAPRLSGGTSANIGLYDAVLNALLTQTLDVADPHKVRAILQGKNSGGSNIKPKDKKSVAADISATFDENVKGLAYLDAAYTVTPVNWNENDVNRELQKSCIEIVSNYFSITENIIRNAASEIEFALFVQTDIKPICIQMQSEFTRKLFTPFERSNGNSIEFDSENLNVATVAAKTNLYSIGTRQGFLSIDEVRERLGYGRIPNGFGGMYRVTGDTMNIENVDEMQKAQKGVTENAGAKNIGE